MVFQRSKTLPSNSVTVGSAGYFVDGRTVDHTRWSYSWSVGHTVVHTRVVLLRRIVDRLVGRSILSVSRVAVIGYHCPSVIVRRSVIFF